MFVYLPHSSGVAYTLSNLLLSNAGRKENHSLHQESGSQVSVWNDLEGLIYRQPEIQVYKEEAGCRNTVHKSGVCTALKNRNTTQTKIL